MKKIGFYSLLLSCVFLFSCQEDEGLVAVSQNSNDSALESIVILKSGVEVEKRGENYFFGGDMILSPEQLRSLDETGAIAGDVTGDLERDLSLNPVTNLPINVDNLLQTRNLGIYPTSYNLWAMVRFVYDGNLTSTQKGYIKQALLELQSKTNLRFYNATGEPTKDPVYGFDYPYVNFKSIGDSDVSTSYVGRIGGKQDISLADFAFRDASYGDYGVIIHEICHAVGMLHEQSRPDRDDYVNIDWNNLTSSGKKQFDKQTTNYHYRGNYDYNSVMGYGSKTTSLSIVIDKSKPMYTKKDGSLIYQGSTVSNLDRMWINYLYLPYVARSDVYRELDAIVYDGDNRILTEQERLQLQTQLNNGNPNPPAGGRIPNEF